MFDAPRSELPLSRRRMLLGAASALVLSSCRSRAPEAAPDQVLPGASKANLGSLPARFNKIDIERFVEDCVNAAKEADAQLAVREVLARGVSDHRAMLAALGEPRRAGIEVLHKSETLTIFSAGWTPQMNLMPHNHRMWALIGIYAGREDNILWRRSKQGVEAYGAECLFEGDVGTLPVDAIHSVTNPLERYTGGVHIYGGDFFATTRSQWDPETLEEQPSDGNVIRAIFERANERMQGMQKA